MRFGPLVFVGFLLKWQLFSLAFHLPSGSWDLEASGFGTSAGAAWLACRERGRWEEAAAVLEARSEVIRRLTLARHRLVAWSSFFCFFLFPRSSSNPTTNEGRGDLRLLVGFPRSV